MVFSTFKICLTLLSWSGRHKPDADVVADSVDDDDDVGLCTADALPMCCGDVTITGLSLIIALLLAIRSVCGWSYMVLSQTVSTGTFEDDEKFNELDSFNDDIGCWACLLRHKPRIFNNSPPWSTSFLQKKKGKKKKTCFCYRFALFSFNAFA